MYKIMTSKGADKALRKIPANQAKKIIAKVKHLADDPYAKNNNVKKIVNSDKYRLRVGDYRVFYELHDDTVILLMLDVKSRGGAYK